MYLQIMPQAVCTRYGLKVGAIMAPLVRVLLVLFFPIAYPISKVEILIQFVSFTGRLFFLLQSVSWFLFRFLIGCWVRDMVFFYGELSSRHSWHSMETRLQLKPDSCVCFLQQPFWFFILFLVGWERWRSDNRWDFYHHRCTWIDRKDSKRCNDSHFQRVLPWSWFNS